MKRFLVFLTAALMVLSLAACGSKDETPPAEEENDTAVTPEEGAEESKNEKEEESGEEATSATDLSNFTLQTASAFSSGVAFVTFRDDSTAKNYSGYIDTKGKLQYYFEGSTTGGDQNKNGYMYSQIDKTLYVITPKGKVTTHELSDNVSLYVYGDGYVVTEEHKSGFEAVEYVYHFYDDAGKELTTYSSGAQRISSITYAGEGTFLLQGSNMKNDAVNSYGYRSICGSLYFAKSDTWHKDVVLSPTGYAINDYSYRDGIFMIRGASQGSSHNTHRGEFTYVDNQGTVQTLTVPESYGASPYYSSHEDGMMVFYDIDAKQIYCYDMEAKSWAGYQGKYTEQMVVNSGSPPVAGDGYVAIPLRGADNNYYTMLLNKSMGDVLDSPVPGIPKAIQDGVLYTCNNNGNILYCYDLKGTQLSEIPDAYANQQLDGYAEGIIVTYQREYLKPDGTAAFEVDCSTGKLLTLPE